MPVSGSHCLSQCVNTNEESTKVLEKIPTYLFEFRSYRYKDPFWSLSTTLGLFHNKKLFGLSRPSHPLPHFLKNATEQLTLWITLLGTANQNTRKPFNIPRYYTQPFHRALLWLCWSLYFLWHAIISYSTLSRSTPWDILQVTLHMRLLESIV